MPVPFVSAGVKLLGVDVTKSLTGLPLVGGLFKSSKDPERFAQNQAWFEAAMKGDGNALEQLRIHSVVASPGVPGWGSAPAAADAAAKYQQAKNAPQPSVMPPAPDLGTLTDALPQPAKDAVQSVAKAVGTTSNTVTIVALVLGGILVLKALGHRHG